MLYTLSNIHDILDMLNALNKHLAVNTQQTFLKASGMVDWDFIYSVLYKAGY